MRWLILVSFLLAGCAAAPAPAPTSALALSPCQIQPNVAATPIEAECAEFLVAEDPSNPAGAQIGLQVAVVRAAAREAASDPLVLLAGGPSQGAREAFAPLLPALSRISRNRDLLIVDQRGTGDSNPLNCPLPEADAELDDATVARQWAQDCLAQLDGDPRFYTTANAAADLEAVRQALGYPQLNLLGVSYGTRLAQVYAQRYPDQVRSLVLDGVVPLDAPLGAAMAAFGSETLRALVANCNASSECASAFPQLESELAQIMADLAANPQNLTIADPQTSAPISVTLTREGAGETLRGLAYSPETAALIPLLVSQAAAGEWQPLAAQAWLIGSQASQNNALGLRFAVVCSEDVPFYSATTLEQSADELIGAGAARSFANICAEWPQVPIEPSQRQPLQAPIATLLLSGEFDPVTPPQWAEQVAATLPNSRHLILTGQGHSNFFRGCTPLLVENFLQAGNATSLDASCLERLSPPSFFLSPSGPTP